MVNMDLTAMSDSTKDSKDAFVQSLLEALAKISGSRSGNLDEKLLFKTLDALKLLCSQDLDGKVCAKQVDGIDIFSPILRCDELQNKWDIVASYVALISVHRQLQPLISGSIASWHHLLPTQEISLGREGDSHQRGFYTVVSQLTEVDALGPQTFEYFKFDLGPTLVASWVPLWLEWLIKGRTALGDVDLLDESKLDFYIATSGDEVVERYVREQEKGPLAYSALKICQRMVRFQSWISETSYALALQRVAPRQAEMDDLPFALQIVMEVVDHPELNFFEAPHLALLLSNALKRIQTVPCHILHSTLGSLASAQSLPALVNMAQYLLAKFLINAWETTRLMNLNSQIATRSDDSGWYKSKPNLFQIPHWFERSIMPPIPPISKSNFVFQDSVCEPEHEGCNMGTVTDLLFESLKTVSRINERILEEYQELGINPIQAADDDIELRSSILHQLQQSYIELYLIPIMTTLVLSSQLTSMDNKLIGKTEAHIMSRFLYYHSVRICEELVRTHRGVGLFYLIEFATKVSSEDLVLQRISIELLNHLFFHIADSLAKQCCEESVLAKRALLDYVTLWNDGTKTFESFFIEVFELPQPTIECGSITLDDLLKLLPDGEEIVAKQRSTQALKKPQTDRQRQSSNTDERNSPIPSVANSIQQNKYDPYSATPFVPAKKSTRSLLVNAKNKAVSYGFQSNNDDQHLSSLNSDYVMTSNLLKTNEGATAGTAPEFSFDMCSPNTQLNMTPRTPNLTTSSLFNSPWNDSPEIHSTPNMCNIVSTGKNYILGGHNRIKNNSRAQSIHIDSFDSENYGM